jgi:hypothetical protein
MAIVRNFNQTAAHGGPHPTEADAQWSIVTTPTGEKLLQISTFGSDNRASQPKVSQTLQFDRSVAVRLIEAIEATFGGTMGTPISEGDRISGA